ncbi:MAG: thioredoxin [Thermodesulfobacteriota bacterium]|nr:thioredoxin [Thermodesulfobacteriota bacterium]
MGSEIILNSDNFETEVMNSTQPVLVDFWAQWCGPCKMVAPIVEELAKEYEGKIKVAKLEVDNNQEIASKYGISSIPTLMVFENSEVKEFIVGVQSKNKLKEVLDKYAV